jgi:hypothetical protein
MSFSTKFVKFYLENDVMPILFDELLRRLFLSVKPYLNIISGFSIINYIS